MKDTSEQIMGASPSLLTEAKQGETNGSVSILRDLDPRLARLDSARRHTRGSLIPIGATLLLGGGALLWLFSSEPFVGDETLPPPPADLAPPLAAVSEPDTSPPLAVEPPALAAAATAPPAGQGIAGGPAVILAAPPNLPPDQANPLKALTVPVADAPVAASPGKPVQAAALKKQTESGQGGAGPSPGAGQAQSGLGITPNVAASKPAPVVTRPVGDPGGATVPTSTKADKAPLSPTGQRHAESTLAEAPKPVSQRDVDIITAIVKDK